MHRRKGWSGVTSDAMTASSDVTTGAVRKRRKNNSSLVATPPSEQRTLGPPQVIRAPHIESAPKSFGLTIQLTLLTRADE
jgi:hypothetical protein